MTNQHKELSLASFTHYWLIVSHLVVFLIVDGNHAESENRYIHYFWANGIISRARSGAIFSFIRTDAYIIYIKISHQSQLAPEYKEIESSFNSVVELIFDAFIRLIHGLLERKTCFEWNI